MDVALALDSASIDLQDERLELAVKKNPCVFENDDLIAPMVYTVLGEKIVEKVINEALHEAYHAEIEEKSCTNAMKERLRKTKITVTVEKQYPPYGEFVQQKKGSGRPRFRAYHKQAMRLTYNAMQEQTIKGLLSRMKPLIRSKGLGRHAFIREIPKEDGAGCSMQRYKETMDVHTAQSECATVGALPGIIALDSAVMLELEPEEGDLSVFEEWTLRDLLMMEKHNGKDLFRAAAMQEDGSVMAIVCRGDGRDEALTNIAGAPAAWAMFTLLMQRNATEESVHAFLGTCFSSTHATAAEEYGEYDMRTGKVSLVDEYEGEEDVDGSEAQDALAEGMFDLSIFKKEPDVKRGAVPAGRNYDSDNDEDGVSRASMTTEAWRNKIMGMQGGIRARGRARVRNEKGAGASPGNSDGGADAEPRDTNTGQPLPRVHGASDAGAGEE